MSQKLPNPFDVEDKEKVWEHFLENSKPISKAEALKKMKEASEMQKNPIALQQLHWIDNSSLIRFATDLYIGS